MIKFNKQINLILEELAKNDVYHLNDNDVIYEGNKIAIVPGSFKPPHKGHWEMIMRYINMSGVEKTIVLISNISTQANANRSLSLSNLKRLGKIKEFIEKNNLHTDDIDEGLSIIDQSINNVSFSMLKEILENKFIKSCEDNIGTEKKFIELKVMIIDYLDELSEKLFKSIRKAGNFEITPMVSKEIFEIFAKAYNVEDKVDVEISDSASPITDTISFINYKCKNCTILLGVSEKGGDQTRWNGINKSIKNETVNVIPTPVSVTTMISATDLRNNINDLKKDYFPDKISNEDFENIKKLLSE